MPSDLRQAIGEWIAPPAPSSAAASAVMRGNRGADTRPVRKLRRVLHRQGFRYRCEFRIAAGELVVRADIAFPRRRVAVFVDGCFWHGCPHHCRSPRTNSQYWSQKIAQNVRRDLVATDELREAGWEVIRVWEHLPIEEAFRLVATRLRQVADA